MKLRKARQIFKSFSDETRIRIIHLLGKKEMSVTEICTILKKNQPNISKHLMRLRLTGLVDYKREGLNVIYHIMESDDLAIKNLINIIKNGLGNCETLIHDHEKITALKK
ncbi:MAG: winged helix-turn-helix transcriptional regulator [Spirochaetes bacterium]|nr:winged helix-turn-helix transcriptional regulator [Spirochaetota bacterium]